MTRVSHTKTTHLSLFVVGGGCLCQQWDRRLVGTLKPMANPAVCKAFQDALMTLPIPAWSVDIDTHVELWERNLLQLAQQFFCKTTKTKARPRLQEATCNLIAFKRSVLDFGRACGVLHEPDIRAHLKAIEKRFIRESVKINRLSMMNWSSSLQPKVISTTISLSSSSAPDLVGDQGTNTLVARHYLCFNLQVASPWRLSRISSSIGFGNSLLSKRATLCHVTLFKHYIMEDLALIRLFWTSRPFPHSMTFRLRSGSWNGDGHQAAATTKVALRGTEPLSWRGGKLIPLHKGKLCRSNPAGYRSIFISSYTTKVYHATLRKHLLDAWTGVLKHLQFGGRRGMSADLAHHCLQAHLAHAVHHRLPAAVLFIDMKAAFYSVVRQGLFEEGPDAAPFLYAMFQLGVAPEHVQDLMTTADGDAAVTGISPHAVHLLKDLMERTYFQIEGIEPVVLTSQGTRPGDPVGDAFFKLAMAVILKKVTAHIMDHTLAIWEGCADSVSSFQTHQKPAHFAWFEVAFVDDCRGNASPG